MLRTTKSMKEKYEKIQSYLFTLIPERWEEIYLYASVSGDENKGELFFYYLPKGILKKKLINVYEVPKRFNINEEQYLKIVENLYNCIKSLKQDFYDTEQEEWTNLTILVTNIRFRVIFKYNKLPETSAEINERNVIWKYNYLGIGGETREERKILDKYFSSEEAEKKQIYEVGLDSKAEETKIVFDRESSSKEDFVMYEKEELFEHINKEKEKIQNSIIGRKFKNINKDNMEKHRFTKNEKIKDNIEKNNIENIEYKPKNQILGD